MNNKYYVRFDDATELYRVYKNGKFSWLHRNSKGELNDVSELYAIVKIKTMKRHIIEESA